MNSNFEVSVEQEVSEVKMSRPHLVILGVGASKATCLNGDRNGQVLPLMCDFVKVVGLGSLFKEWGMNSNSNFEEIFSDLYERNEVGKIDLDEKGAAMKYLNYIFTVITLRIILLI